MSIVLYHFVFVVHRIDHNIEQVAGHVDMGISELAKAEKTQKQNKGLWCIIALSVMICIMLIYLIVK